PGRLQLPFPGRRTTHSPTAFAAACGTPAQTIAGCPPGLPPSSRATSPRSAGSSYTKIPSLAGRLPATRSLANKLPPAPPALGICPRFLRASSADTLTNPPPERYTAPQSKCLLPSNSGCFPLRKTISPGAAIALSRSLPLFPLLRPQHSDFPHGP